MIVDSAKVAEPLHAACSRLTLGTHEGMAEHLHLMAIRGTNNTGKNENGKQNIYKLETHLSDIWTLGWLWQYNMTKAAQDEMINHPDINTTISFGQETYTQLYQAVPPERLNHRHTTLAKIKYAKADNLLHTTSDNRDFTTALKIITSSLEGSLLLITNFKKRDHV